MTGEKRPNNLEIRTETVPTLEEVTKIFEKLTNSKEYTEIRRLEDERGLYVWEISITTEDGHTEYEYNRAGLYPGGKYLQTAVYVTFYDSTSVPISGSSIAKLINNKWNTDLLDVE